MKRPNLFLCLSVLALSLGLGCVSVESSSEGGHEMVTVSNCGWKFLGFITLASGDPDYPNQEVCSWFTNTVTLATNMRLLDEELAKRRAGGLKTLSSFTIDENMLFCILKCHTLKTSAEIVR